MFNSIVNSSESSVERYAKPLSNGEESAVFKLSIVGIQLSPFMANTFSVALPILIPNALITGSAKFVNMLLITGDKISSKTRLLTKLNNKVGSTKTGPTASDSSVLLIKEESSVLVMLAPAVVVWLSGNGAIKLRLSKLPFALAFARARNAIVSLLPKTLISILPIVTGDTSVA